MLEALAYVILGLFLFIVPGFLFSLVLYPRKGSLDLWERMGTSLGLGALLVIYIGYTLAKPELGMLQAAPFLGAVLALCVIFAILAYLRGGFEVVKFYTQGVTKILRKLRPILQKFRPILRKLIPKRSPQQPSSQPQPPQQPQQPSEPEHIQKSPEQSPEQKGEGR